MTISEVFDVFYPVAAQKRGDQLFPLSRLRLNVSLTLDRIECSHLSSGFSDSVIENENWVFSKGS